MKQRLLCVVLGLLSTGAMAADQCEENFKVEGNMLTGKTYKTSAVMAGVQQDAAFGRALAYTVANGFTVTSSDKASGVISAAQTVSFGKGKTVPLGIVFQPDAGNLKVSINYATSGGVISPDGAIRKHFCGTIAAAADGASAAPAAANTGVVPPPNAGRRSAMPGFAAPTAAQQEGYLREIGKIAPNEKIKGMVKTAAPEIAAFVEKVACISDAAALATFGVFAAPDANLRNEALRPMRKMTYHDKAQCLSLKRVHGWKSPANNALQFEAVYVADDSGESDTVAHEVIRQPDGAWLFTR